MPADSIDDRGPDCRGRVALVTGASRGIGAAIAARLARAGASVAVTSRTLDDEPGAALSGSLRGTVAAIEAGGVAGFAVAADLTDAADRSRIVPAVEAALGPVDILVNNAAAAIFAPVGEMPLRRRELLFEVNVHAPVDLVQAVLPGMVARRAGWIVNISSATSAHPIGPPYVPIAMGTTTTAYGAAKAALERFTTGLAAEVFDHGIAVNALAPVTGVLTDGAVAVMAGRVDTSGFEPVEHIAEVAAYLASCPVEVCTGRLLTSGALLQEIGRSV